MDGVSEVVRMRLCEGGSGGLATDWLKRDAHPLRFGCSFWRLLVSPATLREV